MPRPILVFATPGEHGADALTLGVNIARPLGAPLVLANVARTHSRHHAHEREMLFDHLVHLRERVPSDLEVSVDVIASPSQLRGLHDLAVAHDAQILVIGPEQRTAVGRALHSDIAANTVFTAPCAVAIATRRQVMATPRHIGIAWKGAPESDEALEGATRLAERTGATLQIIRVLDPRHPEGTPLQPGVRQQVEAICDTVRLRVDAETRLEWGDAAPVLVEISRGLDLLVLGSRAHSPVRRTLLGSVSSDVLHGARCPVVVFPRGVHVAVGAAAL
ncbi:MAG: universal stress protein [Gemmatimonadaceae bacterium]